MSVDNALTEFLLARIAEDEADAREAMGDDKRTWVSVDFGYGHLAPHGMRWNPARVLAECEAKRRIVEVHYNTNDGDCAECIVPDWGYPSMGGSSPARYPCPTLRLLALPYAEHPDYLEEWRA